MTCFCSGRSCGYPRFPAATTVVASIASRPPAHATTLRYSALLSLRLHTKCSYVIFLNTVTWLGCTVQCMLHNSTLTLFAKGRAHQTMSHHGPTLKYQSEMTVMAPKTLSYMICCQLWCSYQYSRGCVVNCVSQLSQGPGSSLSIRLLALILIKFNNDNLNIAFTFSKGRYLKKVMKLRIRLKGDSFRGPATCFILSQLQCCAHGKNMCIAS